MTKRELWILTCSLAIAACTSSPTQATKSGRPDMQQQGGDAATQGDEKEQLAKKLANPIAALIRGCPSPREI